MPAACIDQHAGPPYILPHEVSMNSTQIDAHYVEHIATLARRYAQALDGIADGVVIHSGSGRVAFLDDRHYPFIPNPHY